MIADILQYLALERRIEFEQKALDASDKEYDDDPNVVKEDLFR